MNPTSYIVLVSCLAFGLLMALLAWWTYALIVNRRYQERLHRRLMVSRWYLVKHRPLWSETPLTMAEAERAFNIPQTSGFLSADIRGPAKKPSL